DVLLIDQLVIHRRNGVLPDELFRGHFGTEIAGAWTHVTVCQFEPGPGEGFGELLRMLQETAGDFLVSRIEAEREIGRQHGRADSLRWIMRVRHGSGAATVLRPPLVCACGAPGQLPFITEQALEEVVAPPRGCSGPGDFQAAGDGIARPTGAVTALPAEALSLQVAAFGLCTN